MIRHEPDDLLAFPCTYEFKAFGMADDDERFLLAVQAAVSQIVPVPRDAIKTRFSSAGKYQCVTVVLLLQNSTQLKTIYNALRQLEGLKYLL
ncbi:MAG: DUF493 domain-containing protein [Deltaproteobacteria bacterium]|nr:DUF493 domain-containing protein [Deltaproteobacteria bacterium]